MGAEIRVENSEQLCDLMCDNKLPKEKEKNWIFTFGCGQEHAGCYVRIKGTYGSAREKMFERFGDKWCFQYTEEEFFEFPYHETKELKIKI